MNQATPGKYAERIERGALLLDQASPGWRERINLDRLELSSCVRCVLGQVSGNQNEDVGWSNLVRDFQIPDWTTASFLGFSLGEEEYEALVDRLETTRDEEVYAELTVEWKQYIEATR